jgi:hypothetical protein
MNNYATASDDDKACYRLSVFIPFMDYFLQQLHQRFLSHMEFLESLQYLLHQHCIVLDEEKTKYSSDTPIYFFDILMQTAIGEACKLS